jgi:hypothetical protein
VDIHATDLVGINGITRVLLLYTCQQGVYPRDHVLPLRLPCRFTHVGLQPTVFRRNVSEQNVLMDEQKR